MNPHIAAAFMDELVKIAEEAEAEKLPHPAAIIGSGLGGLALGYGAGHLSMHGLNKALKNRGGVSPKVLKAAPILSGIAGLGVGAHQAYMWDKAKKSMEQRKEEA